MSRRLAREMRKPTIAYQCRSVAHHHYKREDVDAQVAAGEMEWVGDHFRVATFTEHRIWAKTTARWESPDNEIGHGPTMQLVEPAVVYARRKR